MPGSSVSKAAAKPKGKGGKRKGVDDAVGEHCAKKAHSASSASGARTCTCCKRTSEEPPLLKLTTPPPDKDCLDECLLPPLTQSQTFTPKPKQCGPLHLGFSKCSRLTLVLCSRR